MMKIREMKWFGFLWVKKWQEKLFNSHPWCFILLLFWLKKNVELDVFDSDDFIFNFKDNLDYKWLQFLCCAAIWQGINIVQWIHWLECHPKSIESYQSLQRILRNLMRITTTIITLIIIIMKMMKYNNNNNKSIISFSSLSLNWVSTSVNIKYNLKIQMERGARQRFLFFPTLFSTCLKSQLNKDLKILHWWLQSPFIRQLGDWFVIVCVNIYVIAFDITK